jgi:hypothetical protein
MALSSLLEIKGIALDQKIAPRTTPVMPVSSIQMKIIIPHRIAQLSGEY